MDIEMGRLSCIFWMNPVQLHETLRIENHLWLEMKVRREEEERCGRKERHRGLYAPLLVYRWRGQKRIQMSSEGLREADIQQGNGDLSPSNAQNRIL